MRDSRRARRLRVGVGLLAGCAVLAGCVSVRPLALVPPDRVAQTSLVLDARPDDHDRRRGGRPAARGQVRRAGPGRPGEVWGLAA
jgi:hypothetical protein